MSIRIAILGATGHIAKGMICNFMQDERYSLFLFARSPKRLHNFLAGIDGKREIKVLDFKQINDNGYDVILNCVGIGDPDKLKNEISSIFSLTETFDNLVLDYLKNYPSTFYLNFSSGAVYGTDFNSPVDESSYLQLAVNRIQPSQYYGIAKINSEAKHRAFNKFNIVDLRVFAYFSRFINIETNYFIAEIIQCVQNKKKLIINSKNVMRDYAHPKDLFALVEKCIKKHTFNDAFDVYSKRPTTTFEIIDYFKKKHGLQYTIEDRAKVSNITGDKDIYYSNNRRAQSIGYHPKFSSLDCIIEESKPLLQNISL
ncbi:MAG: NAD(P)-dependent oxidoreductase [Candidatus Omnitrophica bacterium]|nr:NAD(P)-dependent oxidoreductase [Candidatus Omnitrophota bacterium]